MEAHHPHVTATDPQTPVTRLLVAEGVTFKVLRHRAPVFTVEAAAAHRGVSKEQIVKSILLRESKRHRFVLACVSGDARLDPGRVRAQLPGSWKRLSFASDDEIRRVTGGVAGAIAPVALLEAVPVIFDAAIGRCATVNISSGDPLFGLELDTEELIRVSRARLAPIAEESDSSV